MQTKITLTICCLLISIFMLKAQESSDLKIKGDFTDKSLDLVILDLKLNYRLTFEYDKSLTKGIRVSTYFGKTPLDLAMMKILEGTNIDFKITAPRKIKLFAKTEEVITDWSTVKPTRKNFTITGTVIDKRTGETLPFANVLINGTANGATTNIDGYFSVFNVPTDTVLLLVSYLGYQKGHFRITPESDLKDIQVGLESFGYQLQEIEVKATKEEQMISASTGVSRVAITPAALAKLPSYGEKDIFRSLQLLPGISGSNESSSGLYVRGGTPDQNLILFDGFTVYHVDHLFGFFSAFNTSAVKDVQLYKGGFDAKYGGRLSSVVELTGKEGNTNAFNTGFGVSLLSANAFVESPFAKGKGSFLIAGRRSFQSSFYTNIFEAYTNSNTSENGTQPFQGRFAQQEVQPNTYFYDINAKATYRPSSKDILSVSFYNGQDNLDNSRNVDQNAFSGRFGGNTDLNFNRESTDLTAWGNWGTSLKWSRRWSEAFYSNVNLSYSNYYSERDRRNSTTIIREDSTIIRNNGNLEYNDLKDISLKWDNEYKIAPNNQLDFGLQSTWNDIEYKYIQDDTTTVLDRKDQGLTTSLYIQDKHTFADKLILKGGLRNTFYSLTNKLYFEPRASLSYLLSDHIKVKAAWGKYYQFANRIVREDIQQGSRDFWLLADDVDVPISSSWHHIAGVSYENSNWLFDVEAYYKTLDGLSEYSTRFVPVGFGRDRTIAYEEYFHVGTGISKGIEFLAQKKVGKFTGWAGYTLGEVKYDFDAFGDESFYASQDVTHEFKIAGNYKLGKIDLGATFIYATGKPYTGPTGYYELTLLDGTTGDFFELSSKNDLRFDDYHRLDLSASYDFNLGRSKANIGMSITNVYNRKNTWYKEYEVIEGELLETNVTLLGITPSLFFTWTLH